MIKSCKTVAGDRGGSGGLREILYIDFYELENWKEYLHLLKVVEAGQLLIFL